MVLVHPYTEETEGGRLFIEYNKRMIVVAIVAVVAWAILYGYSNHQLTYVRKQFNRYDVAKKQKALGRYKFALGFMKFTNFVEWLLKAALIVIIACIAPPVGFFVALGILWFRSSLKKTNYQGYNTMRKRKERRMRELDDWIIIANQTILK